MKDSFKSEFRNISNPASIETISRRGVIKTLTLGGASLIFSPNVLLACTRKKKDRLGVALVGLGY
jgi:glucose-fructose oxidoreductase